jgi:hypothetical protein
MEQKKRRGKGVKRRMYQLRGRRICLLSLTVKNDWNVSEKVEDVRCLSGASIVQRVLCNDFEW